MSNIAVKLSLLLLACGGGSLWAMNKAGDGDEQDQSFDQWADDIQKAWRNQKNHNEAFLRALLLSTQSNMQTLQKMEENIKNFQKDNALQTQVFNLKKRIFCLYGIIGIELCTCCYFIPQSMRKKISLLWRQYKQWRSNYHAQSISRNTDASLPAPAQPGSVAAS